MIKKIINIIRKFSTYIEVGNSYRNISYEIKLNDYDIDFKNKLV